MIRANEVLEKSKEAVAKKYEKRILKAASNGKRCIVIRCKEMLEDELSILKESGYKVDVEERENQDRSKDYKITISW